jgi:hypothetical protein
MKIIIISLTFLLTIMTSCNKKEEDITLNNCIELSQNPNWITEDFKTNYLIQFPNNYEGTGMVGFEGNLFNKNRTDDKLRFTYSFCTSLYCDDFGAPLNIPIPNSISAKDKNNNAIILNSKKEFCLNGDILGILYYNNETNSTGIYYMKQGVEYLEGLTIYFDNTEYQEVENIIKTIVEN